MDFRPSFAVDATHTCCTRCQNKQLDPPPQLPGTVVTVPTPRRRQRQGWALRLRCSPQRLAFCSVWWWFEGITSAPKDYINMHTDFIRPEPQKQQWQSCKGCQILHHGNKKNNSTAFLFLPLLFILWLRDNACVKTVCTSFDMLGKKEGSFMSVTEAWCEAVFSSFQSWNMSILFCSCSRHRLICKTRFCCYSESVS